MRWRNHPSLKGKLHPQYPDDIQVAVHDGGPRLTKQIPEVVWVSITALENNVFAGRVLNDPAHLQTVRKDQSIRFLVDTGMEYPVMVTEKYLRERAHWRISPCEKCGLSELFDAPSDLIAVTFPNLPADAQCKGFTSFCAVCGGVQGIESIAGPTRAAAQVQAVPVTKSRRPWWKFWARS